MACWTIQRTPEQTPAQREAEVSDAVAKLAKDLEAGRVTLRVGPQGAVALAGWQPEARKDLSDVCALRSLSISHPWEYRKALAKAETMAGRKADAKALAAGVHSHDGGKSWGTH